VIPPNHPAGAATGCLSMPGVCPDKDPLVKRLLPEPCARVPAAVMDGP